MTEKAVKTTQDQPGAEQSPATDNIYVPDVDIYEAGDAIYMVADLPGASKETVDVTVEKNVLAIEATASVDSPNGCQLVGQEYGVGRFRRNFTLSAEVDTEGITAKVAHGVLELTIPKRAAAKTRKIDISS